MAARLRRRREVVPLLRRHLRHSTAATYVVAKFNDELKKQMRVINGATMIGSAACLSQFDEEKDFNNSSFAKPFKYGNMALQIGIGAALLKDGLGK